MRKKFLRLIVKYKFLRALLSYRAYSIVPRLLLLELYRIITIIRYKQRSAQDPEVLLSSLRTRAHIVDKGLRAEDWEVGRSKVVYESLCKELEGLKNSYLCGDPSYQWALQKKIEYENAQKSGNVTEYSGADPAQQISPNALLQLIQSRRSIRSFEDRPIAYNSLRELADVLSWSPTSCNRQPAKLFITQNSEKVAICLKQCAGATCIGQATPCFIAVCADTRFYSVQDRNLPFIDVSLGLQNMLILGHSQGIEAMILNWMHHTPKQNKILREILNIPEYYIIVVNILLGYSSKSVPHPGRKGSKLALKIID